MSNVIRSPELVLKTTQSVPSIEVDNDEISGEYANGDWEGLIAPFTADWVKRKKFKKMATIWTCGNASVSFNHAGFSVFVAQFGLPVSYFEELYSHLRKKLGDKVRHSDFVSPTMREGWRGRVHVQDSVTWIQDDEVEWFEVGSAPVDVDDDPFSVAEVDHQTSPTVNTVWQNCKMSTLYYSKDEAVEDDTCVVRIDDREILVEYESEGIVQYRGLNPGTGHFELHSPKVHGKASLHMFPESSILEGSWTEGGYRGMWRIKLLE